MKRIMIAIMILTALALTLCACQSGEPAKEKTVFDRIRESTAARMDLPDGTSIFVDSEIASMKTFADLQLQEATIEPADSIDDWLYRIVFDPSNKVQGAEQIIVSFHADYVQIDEEFYLPKNGVSYESILEWAKGKFEYFFQSVKIPEDFALSFSWWFMPERKNIMDTQNGTLQKDLVLDGTATADFTPDEKLLQELYDIVCEKDLMSISRNMTTDVLSKDDSRMGVEPNTYFEIRITMNGQTHIVRGDATAAFYRDDDAQRFSRAVHELMEKAQQLPDWKALPEANGAYE